MRVGKLRKMTGFWKGLTFVGNECKMRSALMKYLQEEGLKCQLEDGIVMFEYNECHFNAQFNLYDNYAECEIWYQCGGEEYEALDMKDKTFIADKVNTESENHSMILAFNDNFQAQTSFYFTNKRMMLNLFSLHFEELTKSISMALDIICEKVEDQKAHKNQTIGFHAEPNKQQKVEKEKVQALRRN